MPRKAEERLAEYARTWRERGIRAWGEGWWTMPMTVGDQVGRIVGAPPGSTVMHQNVAVAEAVVLSCFFPIDPGAEPRRLRARQLPVRALPLPGAAGARGRRLRGRRGDRRRDRRADAARPDQPRPLQDGRDPGRRADRAARPRGRRARDPRLLPVGGDRARSTSPRSASTSPSAARSSGSAAGPGTAGSTSAPTSRERLEPTFTGWQAHEPPFGFEEEMRYASGAARFLTGTPNVPAHYAATAGYDLIEEIGVEPHPRELAPSDAAPDRPRRRGGLRGAQPARAGAARRDRDGPRARLPGRPPRAGGAADPLRLPPGRRDPPRAALLHLRRRAPLRRSRRSARSSRPAPTSATSASSPSTELYLARHLQPRGRN